MIPRGVRGGPSCLHSFEKFLVALCCINIVGGFSNSRHVCFINDYDAVRGPHFSALFDELVAQTGAETKRVALVTATVDESDCITLPVGRRLQSTTPRPSSGPLTAPPSTDTQSLHSSSILKQELEKDLELDVCDVIALENFNPVTLEKHIEMLEPTVVWVADGNAFALRYLMRTSGLDRIIQEKCGGTGNTLLFVGQGAGSICGGHSMKLAHVRGDDPKFAPEPQFFGLNLIGLNRSVHFGSRQSDHLENHPKISTSDMVNESGEKRIVTLSESDVFVWSQERQEGSVGANNAMSFVMNPVRKGMIEQLQYPEAVPPLISEDADLGGRQCMGEPAVDPSRMMQMVGDSEWFEEASLDI